MSPRRRTSPRAEPTPDGSGCGQTRASARPPRAAGPVAVSAAELHAILAAALRSAGFAPTRRLRPAARFDDARYFLPTADEVKRWRASRPTAGLAAEPGLFDCDDFAHVFRGHCAQSHLLDPTRTHTLPPAVGVLWGSGLGDAGPLAHVVNLVVQSDRTVWLVDTTPGGMGEAPQLLRRGLAREVHAIVI